MLDMEYFSMMAVRRRSENFCSKQSWPTDWLLICNEALDWPRWQEILKLGHRRLLTGKGVEL